MADQRDAYQAALVRFGKAEAAAKQAIGMIKDVGSTLQSDLASFMGWQYDVHLRNQMPRGGQFNPKSKFDMTRWPDAAALKAILTEWATSRDELENTWQAMTPAQQVGFSAPIKELRIWG